MAGGIGLSYLDPNFNKVATLPDNVPIVGMIFLVGFFFWFAMSQAYENDRRIAEGRPPIEGEDASQKVFSWPDLVYVELICLVVVMAVMIVWSIVLKAPLEEPANPTDSPNPAKAPWYFLGLQEMLVYFDPWLAGVVLPSLIIVGLMAIPYIDTNPKGNGYFTFRERQLGDHDLPRRLPGPLVRAHRPRDVPARPELELLRALRVLGHQQARAPEQHQPLGDHLDQGASRRSLPNFWLIREIFGLVLVGFYVAVLPLVFSKTILRRFFEKMDMPRYLIGVSLGADDDVAADQDVPAMDLQPEVHRDDPGVRVQHMRTGSPCRASRPRSRSIITTTSPG